MAQAEFDAYPAREYAYDSTEMAAQPPLGVTAKALSFLGATCSIALVVGLGVWGYNLTIRDVTDVPVIRALEGPSRIQPDDPGGQLAEHTGLAVNSVQAVGQAEGPAPQVILAPDPIDLTTDDVVLAGPEATEIAPSGTSPTDDELAEAIGTVVALSLEEQNLTVQERADRIAERLAEGVEPLEPLAPASATSIVPIAASVPGVSRSQRPMARPKVNLQNLQQTAAIASASGSVTAVLDANPARISTGTRLVQLGAFDERALALEAWDKIAAQFADYMDGKQRLIQEAKSGGRTFYRLRAVGFDDLNASRRFCAVLVASNAACIPVLAR